MIKTLALPNTLHELLSGAMKDLEKIEYEIRNGNKQLQINMGDWHCVYDDDCGGDKPLCSICLAGCVMREELDISDDEYMCPSDFEDETICNKLEAINSLRMGDVEEAFNLFYDGDCDKDFSRMGRETVCYKTDIVAFKQDMKDLIFDLKEEGI